MDKLFVFRLGGVYPRIVIAYMGGSMCGAWLIVSDFNQANFVRPLCY